MTGKPTGDDRDASPGQAEESGYTPTAASPGLAGPPPDTIAGQNKGMNLYAALGSIGGLTMVSRVLGFVREMVVARVLGASAAADVFTLAFLIPNLFRRLFGEGAFSAGFVPLFSQRLKDDGDTAGARRFAEEVLAVFLPLLMAITAIFMVFMPFFIGLIVPDEWGQSQAKTDFAVAMTRITMPYLIFICLLSLVSGVLNSLGRFAAAAFAPALLNVALVIALILVPEGGEPTVRAMCWSVVAGGVAQLGITWANMVRAGILLRLRAPRLTPGVRELFTLVLPATLAGGTYYISQFFYAYFATRLPEGSLLILGQADRLNQLPLALIGSALGVAILPAVSRAIGRSDEAGAGRVQAQAIELGMLLTIPAAVALAVTAGPIATVLFEGGRFTEEDASITGAVLATLVLGLPAYVLIKILAPGFYARRDMKTPVAIAVATLIGSVLLNFILVPRLGIVALPLSTAIGAWANALLLAGLLQARGHFRMPGWLASRLARQLLAGAAMGAALWAVQGFLGDRFAGSTSDRLLGLGALVGTGGLVYFAVAWIIGGVNRDDILILLRKKKVEAS
ncbi:MAG TPA: murein biosynthesis integral membrane protein MurJ [Allosphingosinicella sp.]|nr:murein biosynthesis integral membrane protein MurJ [Allosphingosinicella sp.]